MGSVVISECRFDVLLFAFVGALFGIFWCWGVGWIRPLLSNKINYGSQLKNVASISPLYVSAKVRYQPKSHENSLGETKSEFKASDTLRDPHLPSPK